MKYKDIYSQVYRGLLETEGEFSFNRAVLLAFKYSPSGFTKDEIFSLATKVMNNALNSGYVSPVRDGVYESKFNKTKTHFGTALDDCKKLNQDLGEKTFDACSDLKRFR